MAIRIQLHRTGARTIAEFQSDGIVLNSGNDMLQLLVMARAQETSNIAVHEANVSPEFFNLKTGVAGDVLQKMVNYRGRLAIIGDITRHLERSESLRALVRESNRGRDVRFVATIAELLDTAHTGRQTGTNASSAQP